MSRRVTIHPVTRLEGDGRIHLDLDDRNRISSAFFQVPDFRGFEKFCEGRAAEELPRLTQKICGVCPVAHHIASVKALDDLFDVRPPETAQKIRKLMHAAFIFEDHLLHFYFMGGPDFLVGPTADKTKRNFFGALDAMGPELGRAAVAVRKSVRELNGLIAGSPADPVIGLPGGVSRPIDIENRGRIASVARSAILMARRTLALFEEKILKKSVYREWVEDARFDIQTYSMGLVNHRDRLDFYDGRLRVVDCDGKEFEKFPVAEYRDHLAERVETWSYMKTTYLSSVGWNGYTEGGKSGIYRVGPLARLNAAEGLETPLAHAEYERMYDAFGGKPVHNLFAYHWARLIEALSAAETMDVLAGDPLLYGEEIRTLPVRIKGIGIGVCEAPRGTLIHHYETDESAIVRGVNLIVATQHNAAAISLSVEKAARVFVQDGRMTDAAANQVETAFRAYDPCMACAAH